MGRNHSRTAKAISEARARMTAALADGASLQAALTDLILTVETLADSGMRSSVLILDPESRTLHLGAAPSLPDAYNAAIEGLEIGPAAGSCGTAAFYGEAVFVDDIKNDPLWVEFAPVALPHGLRACWSMPIKDGQGAVLGTVACYYDEPRHPGPDDYQLMTLAADAAQSVLQDQRKTCAEGV